jgi:hypothetical protein
MKKTISSLFFLFTFCVFGQKWEIVQMQNDCTNRHENSFVAIGDDLLLVGGRGIKPVESFDMVTKKWTKKAETPIEMHHFQAIEYNNELWVIGAFTGKYPHETPLENIYIYNPKEDQWRKGPIIPIERRRGSVGAVVYKSKIYMVGGILDGHWDGHVAWFDEFDPKTEQWTKLPDAPHSRDHINVAVDDNRLFIAGGRRSFAKINQTFSLTEPTVDIFNFKSREWTTLGTSQNIPTPRAGCSTVLYDEKLLVIGGESDLQETAHQNVESLNTKTLTWESFPSLITGRHGTSATLHKGKVFILAGSGNRGGKPELNSMEVLKE